MSNSSSNTTDNADDRDARQTTAKVTLVKPLNENKPSPEAIQGTGETAPSSSKTESLSQTRPKVGRNYAASVMPGEESGKDASRKSDELTQNVASKNAPAPSPLPNIPEWSAQQMLPQHELELDAEDMEAHRKPWDFKSTLFVVTLFAAVTLGLIGTISHHNSVREASVSDRPVPDHTAQKSTGRVVPLEWSPAAVTPRPKLNLLDKPSELALPPSETQQPAVNQPSLLDLPSVPQGQVPAVSSPAAPAAADRRMPVMPESSPPVTISLPQAPVTPAPQSVPTSTGGQSQDLLSIINKE